MGVHDPWRTHSEHKVSAFFSIQIFPYPTVSQVFSQLGHSRRSYHLTNMKEYGSLVEIKPIPEVGSDAESDVDEDVEVTTSLLRTKRAPLGRPEVTSRFWFSKVKANPGDDIATQVLRSLHVRTVSVD